jgi:hypothetical protein
MPKSKRQLADEAWTRLNTPNEDGVLPGQLPLGERYMQLNAPKPEARPKRARGAR